MNSLILVCGPTATGKSAQALQLAQQLGSPLLSADSRQIYRDFDIGTAKPTPAEQQQWPHHLINIADPTETVTVANYQALALALIQKAHTAGQVPVVVGGTGLYIQSLTEGLAIPAVAPHPELREQLHSLSQPLCYAFLHQVDPLAASRIHAHDAVRTIRALEVYYATGQPLSHLQRRDPPPYRCLVIGLTCPMERLKDRIAQRTQQMLKAGWVQEVQGLQAKYGVNLPLLKTLGYDEISRFLAGELSQGALLPAIVQSTRQFAKRQVTWFRRTPGIHWLDCEAEDLTTQIRQLANPFLASP